VTPLPVALKRTPPDKGPRAPGARFAKAKGVGPAAKAQRMKASDQKTERKDIILTCTMGVGRYIESV
jgi:hypothetical protein